MKNLILILSLLVSTAVFAQKISKEEKQALLQEIKELKKSPEKLKALKEGAEIRDIIITQQNEEISDLKKDAQKNDLALAELKDSLKTVKVALEDTRTPLVTDLNAMGTNKQFNLPSTTTNAPLDHSGFKYRVQIGVFSGFDITDMFNEPKYIVHEYVNGMHRYSIANFYTEADAEAFKKEVKRMGLKDAFVTTYNNGYRLGDPRPTPIVNTVAPLDAPAPVVETKVEVAKSGFNVKPATKVVTPSYNSIESNPYGNLNGTVISSSPVKINTKDLNDKMNTAPATTTTVTAPVTTTTTPTTTTTTTTTTTQEKTEPIDVSKEEVKQAPQGDDFLFRDNTTGTKSSGIKINTGK